MQNINLEAVLDNIEINVVVYDKNGQIIYLNDKAVQSSHLTKEELLNYSTESFFKQGFSDSHLFEVVKKEKTAVSAIQTLDFVKPVRCLVTQTPIFDENGEIEMAVGTIQNIDNFNYQVKQAGETDVPMRRKFISSPQLPGAISGNMIAESSAMKHIVALADTIAATNANILISGESGTGKDVLANYIHSISLRRDMPFIAINCAELNENLFESELFGYTAGAFTGAATKGKKGLLESADKGTLFLDEIESMPLSIQTKLLRVLETHEIRKVGSERKISLDLRVIAATNQNIDDLIKEGKFRNDLYYRLNTIPIYVPPLRERPDDIRPLSENFIRVFSQKYGKSKGLTASAIEQMKHYSWPGNVRELKNMVERLVITTSTSTGDIQNIPNEFFDVSNATRFNTVLKEINESAISSDPRYFHNDGRTLKDILSAVERQIIGEAISECGTIDKAAEALGVSKSTIMRNKRV